MFRKLREKWRTFRIPMKFKLVLSLSSIAVILLTSSVISILEYSRMSHYVSDLIADNIHSVNVAQKLASITDEYNLALLAVIGDEQNSTLPDLHQEEFLAHCDSLRESLVPINMQPLADSVLYSYSAYMLTSLELKAVLLDDFKDTRDWYFNRLQPRYGRLKMDLEILNEAIYDELKRNSETFERGFYRSIIPGAVAVAVGLLLVLLLMFFLISYYVGPIGRMVAGLNNYRWYGRRYTVSFDGDDELNELNRGITELAEQDVDLQRRIKGLRERLAATKEDTADK